MNTRAPVTLAVALALAAALAVLPALAGSTNGVAGAMDAYYDDVIHLINFAPVPAGGTSANLAHNGSINNIYMSDTPLPGGGMFIPVLDAIQGDGFNPLWQEVQIAFNTGHPVQQFTSDNDVLAAAAAGAITLTPTGELYRCSVIGKPQSGGSSARQVSPASATSTHAQSWGEIKRRYR